MIGKKRVFDVVLFLLPLLLQYLQAVTGQLVRGRGRRVQTSSSTPPGRLPGLHTSILLGGPGGCDGTQEAILDIYHGSEGSNNPTVLHLPGGAYMNLIPDTITKAGEEYRDAGYTLAVLYYRLPRSTETSWIVCADPWAAIRDVEAAMKVLVNDAETFRVDPNRIVIAGFSAGGHLAALYGATCTERDSLYCPRSLVLHFPFLETGAKIFCSSVGAAFSKLTEDDYNACFPTALINDNDTDMAMPPTVIYHASGDTIVSTREMIELVSSLSRQGIAHEYYEVSGGGHYLVPFIQVVNVSDGTLDGDTYAALVEKSLSLSDEPECRRCDDTPSPWMVDNERDCSVDEWSVRNRCNTDATWVEFGYCRQSCFDYGNGYDICCEEHETSDDTEPSSPPSIGTSCTECNDIPPQFLLDTHQTCATAAYAIHKNCYANNWWVSKKYCQISCQAAERGYVGLNCC